MLLMNDDLKYQEIVSFHLKRFINTLPQGTLKEAIEYAVFPGGKRLRPMLVLKYMDLASVMDLGIGFALTVELLHSYTLVHDDLPCMDNALLRREKESLHRRFTEAIAVLVGDGLLPLSFELLVNSYSHRHDLVCSLLSLLADTIGPKGLVLGQFEDVKALKPCGIDQRERINTLKTAILFSACLEGAGILLGYNSADKNLLKNVGCAFGLIFQFKDDLKDDAELSGELRREVVKKIISLEGELSSLTKKIKYGGQFGSYLFKLLQ